MNASRIDAETTTVVEVVAPGALTCVQDLGRYGWRHIGVGAAGTLDPASAALANRLVGNPANAAVLEIAMTGPTLDFARPLRIALCGAAVQARFETRDGDAFPVPGGRPVTLPAGRLRIGALRDGVRAWLALSGGIDTPPVLGSRSTDLRGAFGGLDGRALRAGDRLPLGAHPPIKATAAHAPAWWVSLDATISRDAPIRFLPACDAASALRDRVWRVDPRSDRQGLRLDGDASPLALPEQVSAAVAPGTVQCPPDGRPIVLLADAQTVGGYPRLGHVIAADLPHLAQCRAGDALRFEAVDRATAANAWQRRRAEIARLEWAIDRALDAHPRS
ncbi:MAG: biotin-dependent carboxyltransferase family protein [Xanthomonadaceae bacterium]|nr:biotin-dependent carboxyltransferase family protein [Xanthomonadaceae bacterium]